MIKIASFTSCNQSNKGEECFICVDKINGSYHLIAWNGAISQRYNTIQQAKLDIKEIYGHLKDFKLL